jgi:hypothetical protein
MSKRLRTCKSHFIEKKKNWQPLTICNIAQAGSLCVSNKYLTALFQSFFSLCILDVVTIYADLKKKATMLVYNAQQKLINP